MKVRDLADMGEFTLVTEEVSLDKTITSGYCGDLLSWVMANAKKATYGSQFKPM